MKNINITIFLGSTQLVEYVADIVPNVGDMVEIPGKGTYCINDRTFVTANNRVKLHVESLQL